MSIPRQIQHRQSKCRALFCLSSGPVNDATDVRLDHDDPTSTSAAGAETANSHPPLVQLKQHALSATPASPISILGARLSGCDYSCRCYGAPMEQPCDSSGSKHHAMQHTQIAAYAAAAAVVVAADVQRCSSELAGLSTGLRGMTAPLPHALSGKAMSSHSPRCVLCHSLSSSNVSLHNQQLAPTCNSSSSRHQHTYGRFTAALFPPCPQISATQLWVDCTEHDAPGEGYGQQGCDCLESESKPDADMMALHACLQQLSLEDAGENLYEHLVPIDTTLCAANIKGDAFEVLSEQPRRAPRDGMLRPVV